jgi:hypothetical protein
MSAAYDIAQAALTDLIEIEKRIMPIIDPGMADVATRSLEALKTILSTTFGQADAAQTAQGIDEAARAELDVKFPGK